MFSQKQRYFFQLSRSYPILRHVDIYDRQSFLRAYILDNLYVSLLVYVLFYLAVWYASIVIKRIEQSNREMTRVVEENKAKLKDAIELKNKKAEYEEVIIKAREAQKVTSKHLETEMGRLSTELLATTRKLTDLEKLVTRIYKSSGKSLNNPADDVVLREQTGSFEEFKVLEPSFPPPAPPEPPPRKYGIFVSRPPGQRKTTTSATPTAASSKFGYK